MTWEWDEGVRTNRSAVVVDRERLARLYLALFAFGCCLLATMVAALVGLVVVAGR